MAFTARDIKDRIVQFPKRYKLKDINTGQVVATYDLEPDSGIVTEQGTVINKAYLQPIENALNGYSQVNIDNIAYDLYSLYLEQYYLGEVSNSPNPSGARAIMFDGFMNTLNLNTVNTNIGIDTVNKVLGYAKGGSYLVPTVANNNCTQITGGTSMGNYANIVDNIDSTTGGAITVPKAASVYATMRLEFNEIKIMSSARFYINNVSGYTSGFAYYFNEIRYSIDNITWYTLSDINKATKGAGQVNTFSFNPIYAKYVEVQVVLRSGDGTGGMTCQIHDLSFSGFSTNTLQLESLNKTLQFNVRRVKLYHSANINFDYIMPKVSFDGINWSNGTLISTRSDIKFPTYTEYETEFIGNGNNIIVRFDFNSNMNNINIQLKRYGLYCYE